MHSPTSRIGMPSLLVSMSFIGYLEATRSRWGVCCGWDPVGVSWKPIVWSRADHYAQWLSYPTRAGVPLRQGSRVTIEEHPGRGFVAAGVEAGSEPAMVWLKPIDTAAE
jgi:hypothetical protein